MALPPLLATVLAVLVLAGQDQKPNPASKRLMPLLDRLMTMPQQPWPKEGEDIA
jgi:hypothetical protein